jgi:enoyl-CoA hydratase/carnithine racemase
MSYAAEYLARTFPFNASTPPSRAAPHDSGPMWVATSHSYDSFIHYTSPVCPAQEEKPDANTANKLLCCFSQSEAESGANGVLVVEFHSNGGSFTFTAQDHTEFVDAFYRISQDRANKVVILTGAVGDFIPGIDFSSFGDVADPGVWSQVHDEGVQILENIANIRVPVIAAIEGRALGRAPGRAHVHSEYVLLANVIVAAEAATFHDVPHFAAGIVPGDGIFTTWSYRAGAGRAEAFLLNPLPITARTAQEWGVVAEVVSNGKVARVGRPVLACSGGDPPQHARALYPSIKGADRPRSWLRIGSRRSLRRRPHKISASEDWACCSERKSRMTGIESTSSAHVGKITQPEDFDIVILGGGTGSTVAGGHLPAKESRRSRRAQIHRRIMSEYRVLAEQKHHPQRESRIVRSLQ